MPQRQQAIDAITRYYTAFNAGDAAGLLACLSDDIAHDINQGERQIGKDAFRRFLTHMDTCYRERLEDIVIMASDDGARGAAEFMVHGEYLATDAGLPEARGQRYVLPAAALFDLSDGTITRVSVHYNLAHWIEQVSA